MKLLCLGGTNPNSSFHAEMLKCRDNLDETEESMQKLKARLAVAQELQQVQEEMQREEEKRAKLEATLTDGNTSGIKLCQEAMTMFDPSSPVYATFQSMQERLAGSASLFDAPVAEVKESNPGAAEKQAEDSTGDCKSVEAAADEEEKRASDKRVRFSDPDPDHRLNHPVRPNGVRYLKPAHKFQRQQR